MKTRPWPILILAFLHLFAPLFITLYASWLLKMNYFSYLQAWLHRVTLWGFTNVVILYPLAGFAIYKMKSWSFPVFLAIIGVGVVSDFNTWRAHPQVFTLWNLLGLTIMNIAVVSYFLIPAVRVTYFNRSLRWWENQPRYRVRLPAAIGFQGEHQGKVLEGLIADVSEGGVFLKILDPVVRPGDRVRLKFKTLNKEIEIDADVVYHRDRKHGGYGLKFIHDEMSRKRLKSIVKGFDLMGFRRYPPHPHWFKSFKSWVRHVFKTGEGLVPESEKKH